MENGLSFESLRKVNEYGIEYWSARELQHCLGYSQWRSFQKTIEKAIESCKRSGTNPNHHFAGAGKQIQKDYHLSRFACYLIIQNGDPKKPEIAKAQNYFAIQTRRRELADEFGLFHKEQLMDRMSTTELAANQFLMTQTREKLKRENIRNKEDAIETYKAVEKEVRAAIAKIGGTLPENIPAAEPIKNMKPQIVLKD